MYTVFVLTCYSGEAVWPQGWVTRTADPDGAHLMTMQDVFRRVIAHEPIFLSEAEWIACSKGVHPANMSVGRGIIEQDSASAAEVFHSSVANGWVW